MMETQPMLCGNGFAVSRNLNPNIVAALLRLREMALKGDARSLDRLLALAQIFNNGAAIESLGDKTVAAEDQAILDAYAAEVLSRALSASAMRLGATDDSGLNADG